MVTALRRSFLMACMSAFCVLCLLPGAEPLYAAQSAPQTQNAAPKQGKKQAAPRKQAAQKTPAAPGQETQAPMPGLDVYAQAPFTEKELVRFIESLPLFLD
jgi:hypothetical protein